MRLLAIAIALSAVGSVGGLLIASTLLLFPDRYRTRLVSWLISYAVGTLLGASLLNLVPEALSALAPGAALGALLSGIVTFFALEKLVLWRHCHEPEECAVHRSGATLIVVGDAVHTFVDGAIIAAAVLTSVPLGLTTALAAATHEVPQEVGDFAVLLAAGYSRRKALVLNLASGAAGIAGAILVFLTLGPFPQAVPYFIGFAAGSFLYVAMADLIPSLHRGQVDPSPLRQITLMLLGIATIVALGAQ